MKEETNKSKIIFITALVCIALCIPIGIILGRKLLGKNESNKTNNNVVNKQNIIDKNSNEYKEYINIVNILKENKEVNNLIEEIKSLEKKATKLEYEKNKEYIEIDKQIEEKTKVLNSNKEYQEYLSKLKAFNNTLLASSSLLDQYIEEKVSI